MRKALVTICCGQFFQQLAALTHPTLKAYASKIGADFINWTDASGYQVLGYKKMELAGLLDTYDRVLFVDTDVIIREDAPDLFEIVPEDQLGMFEEGRYYDRTHSTLIYMTWAGFNLSKWDGQYYNSGVIVLSKQHRDVFVQPPQQVDHFGEQTWLNTLIADRQTKIFPLQHRFNHLLGLDLNFGEDRLDSYFVHYAGMRTTLPDQELLKLIAADLESWRRDRPAFKYRDNIILIVEGGLGAQAAAEPALRYARDVIYRADNLVLVTEAPELLAHLGLPMHGAVHEVPAFFKFHARSTRFQERPTTDITWHQIHPVQLSALLTLGLQLPADYLRPRYPMNAAALAEVASSCGRPLNRLVLLHPGRGRAPATFPAEVWQQYAAHLAKAGYDVAIIGRQLSADKGVVDFDRAPYIDLVDKLSLSQLVALLSQAPVLITNDSGPLQIAGAFDGWMGVISPWRCPDYVLPWRNGSQSWRTGVLQRQPLWTDYLQKPTGSRPPDLACCDPARLRQCLPEAGEIVEFVRRAVFGAPQ
jgi:hypothetical protein